MKRTFFVLAAALASGFRPAAAALLSDRPACSAARADEAVSTPQDYVRILRCPEKAGKVQVRGLVGRVLKGKNDEDFDTLSNDPARKLIFLMGSDGLAELVGLDNDRVLVKIGYTADYIERLKKEGYRFKLVVFKSEGDDGRLATWDNVAELAEKLYPSIASKIRSAIPRLKNSSFSEIEAQAPSRFSAVDKAGKNHPDYIDEARLERSEGELWEVRGFLFYRARLMDLYAGDGFTRDADGKKGLNEYITSNKPLKELPSAVVTDL